jgi:hypothetical protein
MNVKPFIIHFILLWFIQLSLYGQDDFVIRKGSDSYYYKGQLEKCYLKEEAVVEEFTCKKWIHYYEDGSLRRFTIAEPDTFSGIFFPEKSTIFLTEDQKLGKCWFGKKTTLQGLPIYGGFRNITITFHDNSNIACCFLSKTHEIQGIPCQRGVINPVFFYPSGKLKRCTVGKKVEVQNLLLKPGTVVDLDEEGRITSTSEQ